MENQEILERLNLICEGEPEEIIKDFPLSYIGQVLERDPYFFSDQEYADFNKIDQTTCLSTFDMRRSEMRACLTHCLRRSESSGNSFIEYKKLNDRVRKSLKNNGHSLRGTVYPYLNYFNSLFYFDREKEIVAFDECYRNEMLIRDYVQNNANSPSQFNISHIPENIDEEKAYILRDIENQRLSIVTGGPGTGKTTWLKFFISSIPTTKNIMVTAPTGKASRRASEVLEDILTDHENVQVMTIHKFLGYGHKLSRQELLKIQSIDILVIDEASMLDNEIMSLLFRSIGNTKMAIVLEGDINQLPSVGAGNVLRDLQILGVKTYTLTTNYRTENLTIKENSEKILAGDCNITWDNSFILKPLNEVYMDDSDIILSPYISEGKDYSSTQINEVFRANKWHDDRDFHATDEVLFTKTNYHQGYMNGDTGVIVRIEQYAFYILLDHNQLVVEVKDAKDILLLHAMTIHKSQGSEYPEVAIVLPDFNKDFVTRNLLYTAITRTKRTVTIYSHWDIIKQIIENDTPPKQTFISLMASDI